MRAIVFNEFGGPEVLHIQDREMPVAADGEVVVKVTASPVNPTDIMMRDGRQARIMANIRPPYTPGVEFSGRVDSQGSGVSDLEVGQPVMGIVNARRQEGGAHAEYISVRRASVTPIPPDTDIVSMSTIPMNGLTAKTAVEMLELPPGSTLLVTGGAGAVGGYVIELAKIAGLNVVADSKAEDVSLLRGFGVNHIVPRGGEMVAAVRKLYPAGVDGVIDAAVIPHEAAKAVRDGGIALSLRSSNPITDPRLRSHFVNVFSQEANTTALISLAKLTGNRKLTPRIAKRLPMSDAVEANRLVQNGGLRGRVVLLFDTTPQ